MAKSIWTPDTFIPSSKSSFHEAPSHNSFLRIDNHGNVLRSIRLTVTAICPMNLQSFPLDIQECALEIEVDLLQIEDNESLELWLLDSRHRLPLARGECRPDRRERPAGPLHHRPPLVHRAVHLPQYRLSSTVSFHSPYLGNYSRLTAYFTFKRNIGFYLIQIYFPASLIVVISWVRVAPLVPLQRVLFR